ncbi:Alpha/beta hydrolase fold-1 [Penicillium capsulatum]|uniref:Alpha/beta hydrolase fold-1 n=1 Tax=Penicillium capsulatum TaxID=69766 RepID=A0A9W9HTV1_9EURO|nr:Alpha/beta hydrolase fold-1 [Penicillium capsulatum]KAJ6106417.1 Alpha/beta hydrolase fold-1 [Penicillium capsulatum]
MPLVTVNSHRLNYADSHPDGPPTPSGLTLVFVHGLGSSQNYYFPVIPHLSSHRCITVDTYGAARSPYTGEAVSIPGIAEDVIGVLDALKISKAVVVGHSMGGLVVTELGARYPDRIQGVVAIGPTHPSDTLVSVMGKRAETVLEGIYDSTGRNSSSADCVLAGMEPMANTIPTAAVGSQSTPLQRAFIRELLLGQDARGYAALCRAIASAPVPEYAAVRAPFLLIAGAEDKSAAIEGCKHIFEHVSSQKKSMEVLTGVGHWHCLEAGDEVGALIARFVEIV